jgi:hypothetical protein
MHYSLERKESALQKMMLPSNSFHVLLRWLTVEQSLGAMVSNQRPFKNTL